MTTHQMDSPGTLNTPTGEVVAAASTPFSNSTQILLASTKGPDTTKYREELALRLHELELEEQALRTSHNSVTQICRLSDEVLGRIFLGLALMARQETRYIFYLSSAEKLRWVPQTNICRHWREVAIRCTSLWTRPVFNEKMPEWATIMLARSKQLPLTLNLNEDALGSPPDPTNIKALSTIAGRLRVVNIQSSDYGDGLSKLLSHCQWSTAPMLESLTVDNSYADCMPYSRGKDPFPKVFLLGRTPSLRILEVLFCYVKWSKLPVYNVPQMTHLSLAGGEETQSKKRPSTQEFLNTLLAMPLLESLKLVNFLPIARNKQPQPTRTTLPARLTDVELEDSGANITRFFNTVALPRSATVKVFDRTKKPSSNQIKAQILSAKLCLESQSGPQTAIRPSILNGVRKLEAKYVYLDSDRKKKTVFKMWPLIDDDPENPATFKFKYKDDADYKTRGVNLHLLQEVFDLVPLEMLILEGGSHVCTDTWRTVFAPLPNLKEIKLVGDTHFGRFVRAIRLGKVRIVDPTATPPRIKPLAFPSLSKLTFSGIDLDLKRTQQKKKAVSPFKKFCQLMETRSASSAPIHEVIIEDCKNIAIREKWRLEASAPRMHVQWDEKEHAASTWATLEHSPESLAESSDDAGTPT
ncbi:hypothetical protein DFP72DRAFT_1147895 [Ephemerocybe angulata]|uniref:F-box domain-containing protein n=1 Tax=Ephemerocybe angulata TaxID=980116 RepID=A0A8H6MEC9_9AGAR|nr:hypothetical protein DFP72DRAFT_1147895 [Tulosesus angulatus]